MGFRGQQNGPEERRWLRPLEFAADETIESTVYLTRVTLLDTVSVAGSDTRFPAFTTSI